MEKYNFKITGVVQVEAKNIEEAKEIVTSIYKDGKISSIMQSLKSIRYEEYPSYKLDDNIDLLLNHTRKSSLHRDKEQKRFHSAIINAMKELEKEEKLHSEIETRRFKQMIGGSSDSKLNNKRDMER